MGFIIWHYTKGLSGVIYFFDLILTSIVNNFSFIVLLRTLFSPWRRMVSADKTPGFSLERFFTNLTFDLISRGIGFVVRVILFITGFTITLITVVFGILITLLWIGVPFIGIPYYISYLKRHDLFIKKLIGKLEIYTKEQPKILFSNEAGKFIACHTGININTLISKAEIISMNNLFVCKSYEELLKRFLDNNIFESESFRLMGVTKEDLLLAASWWDAKKIESTMFDNSVYFKRQSLGVEILYGYTPYLNKYVSDLATTFSFSHHLIGREKQVVQMERILSAGNSVALVGAPGVGKKTVVLEFAKRAITGQLGPGMAFRKILELDYYSILAGNDDLGTKKSRFASVLEEAAKAGNIILVIKDIHRLTNVSVEGYDFTDIFEKYLEGKELKIITIVESIEYERFVAPNLRLRKFLERVEVIAPSKDEARFIIRDAAEDWEQKEKVIITTQAISAILEGSDRYVTDTPFPEKALEILDAALEYDRKMGDGTLSIDDVNFVLSEKTGISLARLTEKEKELLSDVENLIHQTLINQDAAVTLIGKSLRSRTVGVSKEDRPIGSFLFLGPTGVGKTETAKALARIYYGSEGSMVRFDMAQYSSDEGLERLLGSVTSGRPGDLTTIIKNKPASLLLLDEIEKAPRSVHNLLLTILDEGYIIDAFGKKIDCRHLFIIGTSNAGAEYIRKLVTDNVRDIDLQKKVMEHVLVEGIFYPEFLNRFDGVVVYEPLTNDNLQKVAELMFKSLEKNLKSKHVDLTVEPAAVKKLAIDGYEPAFGARPMRRILDLEIGDLLGRAILRGEIKEGDKIKLEVNGNSFVWTKL